MVHVNAGQAKPDPDLDFFAYSDKNGVFETLFFWRWCLSISGDDLKLGTMDMERVSAGLHHHTAAVANHPNFCFILPDFFIDTIHVERLAIDCAADAHRLELENPDHWIFIRRDGWDCRQYRW